MLGVVPGGLGPRPALRRSCTPVRSSLWRQRRPSMSHSVQKHLAVTPEVYDEEIRRFVPGYDAMLDEVVGALEEHLPRRAGRVLDLGAGTGALTARIAARLPGLGFTLLDADAAMLALAAERLAPIPARLEFREGSFSQELPACDAAVASLALHHLPARNEKCHA